MTDALHRLLEVQDLDVAADQLRHRRATLPDRGRLAAGKARIADSEESIAELTALRVAHLASQRKAEDDLEALATRLSGEEKRLSGRGITALREVEAIQAELAAIRRRQSQLEEDVLGDMESVEELTRFIADAERERAEAEREVASLIGTIGEAEAAIDAELAANLAARAVATGDVPSNMLATYEQLRAKLGGVAIARLEGGHCMGCHLALPATEIAALRRAAGGAVVTHEECGRILVP